MKSVQLADMIHNLRPRKLSAAPAAAADAAAQKPARKNRSASSAQPVVYHYAGFSADPVGSALLPLGGAGAEAFAAEDNIPPEGVEPIEEERSFFGQLTRTFSEAVSGLLRYASGTSINEGGAAALPSEHSAAAATPTTAPTMHRSASAESTGSTGSYAWTFPPFAAPAPAEEAPVGVFRSLSGALFGDADSSAAVAAPSGAVAAPANQQTVAQWVASLLVFDQKVTAPVLRTSSLGLPL